MMRQLLDTRLVLLRVLLPRSFSFLLWLGLSLVLIEFFTAMRRFCLQKLLLLLSLIAHIED